MCIVCGCKDFLHYEEVDLALCTSCGFVWQVSNNIIDYTPDYHEKYEAYPEKRMSQLRANFIERNLYGDFNTILDVGFCTGAFLEEMHLRGYITYGSEVEEYEWSKAPVIVRPWKGEPVDVVTFYDSLEHIPNASELIDSLNTHFIVISVPNFKGIDNIEKWKHYRPDEHIYYFNLRTLGRFMLNHGYALVSAGFPEDEIRNTYPENILTSIFRKV